MYAARTCPEPSDVPSSPAPGGSAAVRAGGLALTVLLFGSTAAVAAPDRARPDTSWVQVTAESPPSVRLAFEDLKTLRIPEVVAEKYSGRLESLSMTCRVGTATVADVANAAVGWLNERASREYTRLEFLTTFDESLGPARKSAPNCSTQARSVLLGMARESDLREMEIRTLQSMLRNTFDGPGPG